VRRLRETVLLGCGLSGIKGKKVAVLTGFDSESMDRPLVEAIDRAAEYCRAAGAEIVKAKLP
jgi:aspartyl-tRNA(Asn)/glutamyl-tRNA(Gln) amidotransferase subunit A